MWISVCEHYHFRARKRKKDISCKSERSTREVTLTRKQNKLRSRAKSTRQTNGINCSEGNYSYTRKNNNLTQGRIPFLFKFRKLSFLEFRSYFPSVSRKSLLILILRYGQEFSLRSGVTDDSFERHVKYSRNYSLNSCNFLYLRKLNNYITKRACHPMWHALFFIYRQTINCGLPQNSWCSRHTLYATPAWCQ